MLTNAWEDYCDQLPISDIDQQLDYWTTVSDDDIDLWGTYSLRDRSRLYASLPVN
jgi:hypothetical protein